MRIGLTETDRDWLQEAELLDRAEQKPMLVEAEHHFAFLAQHGYDPFLPDVEVERDEDRTRRQEMRRGTPPPCWYGMGILALNCGLVGWLIYQIGFGWVAWGLVAIALLVGTVVIGARD